MRALLLAAAAVHVALLVATFLTIGVGGELRPILALLGAAVVSGIWTLWLNAQERAAALARPPVPRAPALADAERWAA